LALAPEQSLAHRRTLEWPPASCDTLGILVLWNPRTPRWEGYFAMLVHNSNRVHPEFELAEARRIFTEAGADQDLSGELISSPHDLFSVETLRDRYGLRT